MFAKNTAAQVVVFKDEVVSITNCKLKYQTLEIELYCCFPNEISLTALFENRWWS